MFGQHSCKSIPSPKPRCTRSYNLELLRLIESRLNFNFIFQFHLSILPLIIVCRGWKETLLFNSQRKKPKEMEDLWWKLLACRKEIDCWKFLFTFCWWCPNLFFTASDSLSCLISFFFCRSCSITLTHSFSFLVFNKFTLLFIFYNIKTLDLP